jgi:hypothetical protein
MRTISYFHLRKLIKHEISKDPNLRNGMILLVKDVLAKKLNDEEKAKEIIRVLFQ